jgi:HK97 family phage major capsid protein
MKNVHAQVYRELQEASKAYADFYKSLDTSREITGDEATRLKDLGKKADELKAKWEDIQEHTKRMEGVSEFMKEFETPTNQPGAATRSDAGDRGGQQAGKGLIHLLKNSEEFMRQLKTNPRGLKTIITGEDGSAGDLLTPQIYPNLFDAGVFRRDLSIIDLVTHLPLSTDVAKWMKVSSTTNNAAPVAQPDSIDPTDNTGRYPESAIVFDAASAEVKWIGHTIPIHESVLQDVPQLLGLVRTFMTEGLQEEVEDQILTGDGTGENLLGIFEQTGIQTQAFSTSILETLRKAITLLEVNGNVTNVAIGITPATWEAIELLLDAENRYLMGGPVGLMRPQLWGKPIVKNRGITTGHALVGEYRQAVLFDRLQIEVEMLTQHSDWAAKNFVGLRVRTRKAFGVVRPAAFCDATLS